MSTKTANYNLDKPDMNDDVEQTISDLASNFQIIDTELKNQTQAQNTIAIQTLQDTSSAPNGPTKKVQGYNMVSLPNNAVGQLSVTLLGNTVNVIEGQNFENTGSGWSAINFNTASCVESSSEKAYRGSKSFKAVVSTVSTSTRIEKSIIDLKTEKYYMCGYIFPKYANLTYLTIGGVSGYQATPVPNQWNKISAVIDLTGLTLLTDKLRFYHRTDSYVAGEAVYFDDVILINLTAMGLASLTKEECDARFNWMSTGTNSTLSSRITATKNLFTLDDIMETGYIHPTSGLAVEPTGVTYQILDKENNKVSISVVSGGSRRGIISKYLKAPYTNMKFKSTVTGVFRVYIHWYDAAKNSISSQNFSSGSEITLTKPANAEFYRWNLCADPNSTVVFDQCQIEQGTIATAYEPFASGGQAYTPADIVQRSLPNGTKDEVSLTDGTKKQNVQPKILQATDVTALNTTYINVDTVSILKPTDDINYNNTTWRQGSAQIDSYTIDASSTLDQASSVWKIFPNQSNTLYIFIVPKGYFADLTTAKNYFTGKTLTYQLSVPVVTKVSPPQKLTALPNGTLIAEPSINGYMQGIATKVVTTSNVPIKGIRKVVRFDISDGMLIKTDVTADCSVGDNNTSLTIANVDPTKTYFYDCSYAPELSTSYEIVAECEVENSVISHDYAASAVDWVLTSNESMATMLTCTNAGGAVKIITQPLDGHMYVIKNSTSYTLTIKTATSTGVTIGTGKTATVIYDGSNYIKLSEV